MTNETELSSSDDVVRVGNFTTHTVTSEEPRHRVSISHDAIQADNERQKRNNSLISSRSNVANGDGASNCYTNPTFQHCPSGKVLT